MSPQSIHFADRPESNLIVTDSRPLAIALVQALANLGQSSPEDRVVSVEDAAQACQSNRDVVQRVLVALGDDATRGLKAVRQLREVCSVPLFVVGLRDAGLILDAIHAGADDFIEDCEPLDEHLAKALSRHKSRGKSTSLEGQVICVASARGGCGSSIIAVNLATALAQRGVPTALCDFDLMNGACDALLNLRPKHTIMELGRCLEKLDHDSVEMAITQHACGVRLLAAPAAIPDGQIVSSELCPRVLRTIRQMYSMVLVDLPRLSGNVDPIPLLSVCDKFVVVTRMDFNAVRSTRRVLDYFDRSGVPRQRVHLVGNRLGEPNGLSVSIVEEALKRDLNDLLPDDVKGVNRSINCGTPLVLDSPVCRLSKALNSLADSLIGEQDLVKSKGHEGVPAPPSMKIKGLLRNWSDWMLGNCSTTEAVI